MFKAMNIAQLTDGDHRRNELKAAEGHQSLHRRFKAPGLQQTEHGSFDALDALVSGVDALQIFFEDGLHGWMRQNQFAQIAHVRLTPIGFALVTITMTQEKGFEPMTATSMIIDGIGASAAQIANSFVGGFRHIDGSKFTGPKESRDGAGIPFVGFEG